MMKMDADSAAHAKNADAIVAFARPLLPMLKDLGREHTAKELEQLLFILDSSDQDAAAWLRDNSAAIGDALIEGFKQMRPPQ
jgi:hypothetical protein